ncbi:MAG TPA: metalloregulator ArsR/SmtB family transcription factor [Tepidisphaeraceae bacterium]|nr:metalloregulator ArsR/SmtB family transcription factor [Tepidisphaeraceae bacterium]
MQPIELLVLPNSLRGPVLDSPTDPLPDRPTEPPTQPPSSGPVHAPPPEPPPPEPPPPPEAACPADDPGYSPEQQDGFDALLEAVGHPVRRSILRALAHLGRAHVGALADHLGIELATVSNHLAKLKLMGFVHHRREGKHVGYALAPARVRVERGAEGLTLTVIGADGTTVTLRVPVFAASPSGAS